MSKEGWNDFLALCKSTKDEKMLSEVLELFLTPEEKSSIETRYLIVKALLEKKQTQRKISEHLNVSIAKITRGSNELKRISVKLMDYLRRKLSIHD